MLKLKLWQLGQFSWCLLSKSKLGLKFSPSSGSENRSSKVYPSKNQAWKGNLEDQPRALKEGSHWDVTFGSQPLACLACPHASIRFFPLACGDGCLRASAWKPSKVWLEAGSLDSLRSRTADPVNGTKSSISGSVRELPCSSKGMYL